MKQSISAGVRRLVSIAFAVSASQAQPAHAGVEVVETEHYRLHIANEAVRSDLLRVLLEQAWPGFAAFFGAEPALAKGEKLAIKVYPDRATWLDGALADGAEVPAGADFAWLSRASRTAYAYRDANAYVTRAHVLYAACLQFHAASKTKNLDLDTWYVHGIAESLVTHAWDGERLTLGIAPRISVQDHAARALAALGGDAFGLDAFSPARIQIPCLRWSAVRFAREGAGGKYRPRFEKLALGARGSKLSGEDFLRSLGRAESISQEFAQWLHRVQLPFEAVRGDWEDWLDGRIATQSPIGHTSLAVARGAPARLHVSFRRSVAEGGAVGIVLALDGPDDYQAFRIQPPHVTIETYVAGKIVASERMNVPAYRGEVVELAAERTGNDILVVADGQPLGPFTVQKPRLGFAVFGGAMVFDAVEAY